MLSLSFTYLVVKQRVGGVEFSYLPCLASGQNSNLTSDDMADLWQQGISVDNNNYPVPENIPVTKNIPLPQLKDGYSWRPEIIICPRRSSSLHSTYDDFKNYSREEVTNMKKLEVFLILFPIDYIK